MCECFGHARGTLATQTTVLSLKTAWIHMCSRCCYEGMKTLDCIFYCSKFSAIPNPRRLLQLLPDPQGPRYEHVLQAEVLAGQAILAFFGNLETPTDQSGTIPHP